MRLPRLKIPPLLPRQPLTGIALAASAGIWLADGHSTPWCYSVAATLAFAAAAVFTRRTWAALLFVASAFFTIHSLHFYGSNARALSGCFRDGPRVVKVIGLVADEPQLPQKFSRYVTCHFPIHVERLEIGGVAVDADAMMRVNWNGPVPEYGDRVSILGSARNLTGPRNPGEFDYAEYEKRRGIYGELRAQFARDCVILANRQGNPFQRAALAARKWIKTQLAIDLEDQPEAAEVSRGMLLGVHGDASDQLRELLQRTGTVHLFAVSGLTVAMIAVIASFLLKAARLGRKQIILIMIPLLCAYAVVTGLNASCVRATVMYCVFAAGGLFDRKPAPYNSLSAAALFVLAWDTNQLFTAGFQFSFLVVLAVIWLTPKLEKWMLPVGMPDSFFPEALWSWRERLQRSSWSWAARAICVSAASWVGSLAFTVGYFHLFSPNAIVANLIAVPLAWAVLALGVAALLSAPLSGWLVAVFNNANLAVCGALLGVLNFFSRLPGGSCYVPSPGPSRPAYEVTVLDVGAGSAAHLRLGGSDWMINTGHDYEYKHSVLPYLRSRGVNELDGLILTHGDVQHIGGALTMLDDFYPKCVAESALKDRSTRRRDLHAALETRGEGKAILAPPDVVELAPGATLQVLYPPPGIVRSPAADKALVLLLQAEGARVLFTSAAGFSTEEWLIQHAPDLRADVLVKSLPKKDLSGTPDFLRRVQPRLIVCGAPDETAGSPDSTASLEQSGAAVFHQELTGAVTIALDAGEIRARAFVNGQTFLSRAR